MDPKEYKLAQQKFQYRSICTHRSRIYIDTKSIHRERIEGGYVLNKPLSTRIIRGRAPHALRLTHIKISGKQQEDLDYRGTHD
jgi:hypothetical protein